MRRKASITLIILAFFVVSISGICYWQKGNLKALYYAVKYTDDQQAKLQKDSDRIIKELSEKFAEQGLSELTEEAVQMLNEGTLTEDDAIKIITGEKTLEEIKEDKKSPEKTPQKDDNPKVASLVGKLYVLRSTYMGRLNSLIGQAKAEVMAGNSKTSVASKYIGIASGLEGQCDAQVEGVLSQIAEELKKTGGDLSLVSELRSAYQNEKSVKKAALLSQYT